ncbi:MAG: adenylate kinase family protein [Candidatus Aenigmarchaeota archaeon]|nr:adenylate kinase family protein [Candidatus Aenigmarchaeota archaeon]
MKGKIIAITGTPGTGKSSIAKDLAKKLNYKLIDLNDIIIKQKLYSGYDRKMRSYVVDINKIKNLKFENNVIIEGHLSHFLKVDKVIVLRCKPEELEKRLKRRKYSKEKIKQNVESELIGIITWEARKYNKVVYDIDTAKKTKRQVLNTIIKYLKTRRSNKIIDWCLYG